MEYCNVSVQGSVCDVNWTHLNCHAVEKVKYYDIFKKGNRNVTLGWSILQRAVHLTMQCLTHGEALFLLMRLLAAS